jgi:DNA-binding NtrC family response regulator
MMVAYKQLRSSINNALEMLDTNPFNNDINVLVLDDAPAYIEELKQHLNKIGSYGVKVFSAHNTAEALSQIKQHNIDICISDYFLENETALTFIDHLQDKHINLPVIVITSDNSADLNPLLLSHGALDLIERHEMSADLLDKNIRFAIRRNQIDKHIASLITGSIKDSDSN